MSPVLASKRLARSPRALGYAMPAEWAPHRATWIAWPHNKADWPGKFAPIPWVFAEIVRHLGRHEKVAILVKDAAMQKDATKHLEKAGAPLASVEFVKQVTDRGGQLALQRLGQVRRLEERREGGGAHRGRRRRAHLAAAPSR